MRTMQGGQDTPVLAPPRPRCVNCTSRPAVHQITVRPTRNGDILVLNPVDRDAPGDPFCRPCTRALGVTLPDDESLGPRLLAGILLVILLAAVALVTLGPEPCTDGTGRTICGAQAPIVPATAPGIQPVIYQEGPR